MKLNPPLRQIFIHSIPLFYVLSPGNLINIQAKLDGVTIFPVLLMWVVLFDIALTHNQYYERALLHTVQPPLATFIACSPTAFGLLLTPFFSHHTFFDFLMPAFHVFLVTLTMLKPCLLMSSRFELLFAFWSIFRIGIHEVCIVTVFCWLAPVWVAYCPVPILWRNQTCSNRHKSMAIWLVLTNQDISVSCQLNVLCSGEPRTKAPLSVCLSVSRQVQQLLWLYIYRSEYLC